MSVALDDEFVYWSTYGTCPIDEDEPGDGAVFSMRRVDGSAAVLIARVPCPDKVVASGDDIYWLDQFIGAGWISTAKRDGSRPRPLVKNLHVPRSLKADAQSLYYFDTDGIYQVDREGATTPRLFVRVRDDGGSPEPFVIDETNVYWLDGGVGDVGALFRAAKASGVPEQLAPVMRPLGLALSSAGLFWAAGVPAIQVGFFFLPWSAAMPQPLTLRAHQPASLAAFGNDLYWSEAIDSQPGGVYHLVVGKPDVSLIDSELMPYSLAADSQFLFWTDQNVPHDYNGRLMRMCR